MGNASERRLCRRYSIVTAIRYRVSECGNITRWLDGKTCDLSSTGVFFRCRDPLPPEAHVEMVIDWPSKQDSFRHISLRAAGHVVRRHDGEVAVRMTSSRLVIGKANSPSDSPGQ
jgi:c-di-GMP-binding flagellar brake protein YcgR